VDLLKVESVEAGYGLIQVLWETSIIVEKNQCVVLLGVNGAGKTTLLRTIIGLVKARKGDIVFNGEKITGLKPNVRVSRGIAYMSELAVVPDLTVEENLKLGGYLKNRDDTRRRADKTYEYFPDLKAYRTRKAGSLSGGQRKMLGVAKTLMSNPKILVMDEPSSGLSPKFVKKVIEILKVLHEEERPSMLIAEQNVAFLDLAQKIYILDKGKVTFTGSVNELKENDTIRETYFGIMH
jgi:branched-chain amino acid transport system ATP-binding protein